MITLFTWLLFPVVRVLGETLSAVFAVLLAIVGAILFVFVWDGAALCRRLYSFCAYWCVKAWEALVPPKVASVRRVR